MSQLAKIFTNGRSQAVRLPAAFRFVEKEVYVRKDPESGDVILSRKPADWDSFFQALRGDAVPPDSLSETERGQAVQERDPFEGYSE